jgi:hypothetical protein
LTAAPCSAVALGARPSCARRKPFAASEQSTTPMISLLPNVPGLPLLAFVTLWYALPLIVSVSLVCSATRHELMRPIVEHAVRFGVWVLVFMALFVGLLTLLESMV